MCVISAVPYHRFSPQEIDAGAPSSASLRDAVERFRLHGCMVFENAFSVDYIDRLRTVYLERYRQYFEQKQHADALTIGHRRYQITVEVREPFNSPMLYANPLVFPIIQELLGAECIVGVFGSVLSLPGSEAQHVHRDHPALYADADVNRVMPCFAITVAVPLVALNEMTGTTRMWVGSHVQSDAHICQEDFFDPMAPVGACVLFDLRLMHGGLANQSDMVRPMLYNAYYRPWFFDSRNYSKQPPLVMEEAEFQRMHRANRRLFIRAETPQGKRLSVADPYKALPA